MTSVAAPSLLRRVSVSSVVAAWNAAIREAVDGKCFGDALDLFSQMRRSGHRPDWLTFPLILKSCANSSQDLSSAMAIHAAALKSPFSSDIFVQASLLNLYLKYHQLHSAFRLFDEMPDKDLPTWNTFLMGISQLSCSLSNTLQFFHDMRMEGLSPDIISFLILAQSCAAAENSPAAAACHSLAVISGAYADVSVKNTFVSCYSKCGDISSAELVFSEISPGDLTAVSWSSMISSYACHGKFSSAAACFSELRRRHGGTFPANAIVSLLSHCTLSQGQALHSLVITGDLTANSIIGNTLISLYCDSGDLTGARLCFDSLEERTSITWSTMISGCASCGELSEAVKLFQCIRNPNEFAMAALLSESSGELTLGRALHLRAISAALHNRTILCNSLMDMYVKNGCPDDAKAIFSAMGASGTVVSWTIMISGYALNGRSIEALNLLRMMVEDRAEVLPPNAVTFLAALQACSHGGLLEEGLECFTMMEELFGIVPSVEHYACIVDLFARKGMLKEAMRFAEEMPVKPDAVIWGSLLGACIGSGEFKLGEEAARWLQEMEPRTAAPYVSLANTYAVKKKWGAAAAVLGIMREKGAMKVAGESSVHAGGCLHRFLSQESSHPEMVLLEEVLLGLDDAMKEEDVHCLELC